MLNEDFYHFSLVHLLPTGANNTFDLRGRQFVREHDRHVESERVFGLTEKLLASIFHQKHIHHLEIYILVQGVRNVVVVPVVEQREQRSMG